MDQHPHVQVAVMTVKKDISFREKKHNLSGWVLSVILISHHLRIWVALPLWNIEMNIDLKVFLYLEALILI